MNGPAAAQPAAVVLLVTESPGLASVRPDSSDSVLTWRNVFNGRNVLDLAVWHAAGWGFRSLRVIGSSGRPSVLS